MQLTSFMQLSSMQLSSTVCVYEFLIVHVLRANKISRRSQEQEFENWYSQEQM